MPIPISPTIASITINGHTYVHSDWETNTPATLSGLANDFVTSIQALGETVGTYTATISGDTTISGGDAVNLTFIFDGALSAAADIVFPPGPRAITVVNNTTGSHALLVGYATGTTATVPAGGSAHIVGDGANHRLVDGIASAAGGLVAPGTLTVAGATALAALTTSGDTALGAALTVAGLLTAAAAVALGDDLTVAGASLLSGAVIASDALTVAGVVILSSTVNVGDDLTVDGDIICVGGIVAPAIAARHPSIATALYADSPAGTSATVIFQDTSVPRWAVGKSSGSDFGLAWYNSSGVYQSHIFTVDDVTGRIKFYNVPTSATGLATGEMYLDSGTMKLAP